MNRRTTLLSFFASASVLIAPRAGRAAALPDIAVYRNPGCGCCEGWVKHMIAAGFKVTDRRRSKPCCPQGKLEDSRRFGELSHWTLRRLCLRRPHTRR